MKKFLKVLLGLNLAAFTHVLRGQPRRFTRACRCAVSAARFPSATHDLGIPSTSLGEILGDCTPEIHLTVRSDEEGALPSDQALALAAVLVADNPSVVLEIGTFVGATTRLMAVNLPAAVIHTVDLPPGYSPAECGLGLPPKDDFHLIARRVVGREFAGRPCASRIVQHLADTATWDFRKAGHPSFFFIDGSHTYEYCRNDSDKCFALCRGKGVFLWHDCDHDHPGVLRCLCEWRAMGRDVRRIAGTPIAYWKGA